jgi:mannose-6-phosphate isomerase-like protein (cupin superfamily)
MLTPPRMTRAHADDLPWTAQNSPKGKYGLQRRRALSHRRWRAKGHRHLGRRPSLSTSKSTASRRGRSTFPLHEHSAQWEAYYVLSGSGQARTPKGKETIQAGDYLVFPPGEAHQLINTGSEDLTFLVIADQPQADVIHYPDSGKWMTKPQRKVFEIQEVDYFKGEE